MQYWRRVAPSKIQPPQLWSGPTAFTVVAILSLTKCNILVCMQTGQWASTSAVASRKVCSMVGSLRSSILYLHKSRNASSNLNLAWEFGVELNCLHLANDAHSFSLGTQKSFQSVFPVFTYSTAALRVAFIIDLLALKQSPISCLELCVLHSTSKCFVIKTLNTIHP